MHRTSYASWATFDVEKALERVDEAEKREAQQKEVAKQLQAKENVESSATRAAQHSAAQIGLTRQLAHELGAWGITVNNVAPGFVRSNPTTERQWDSYGEEGQRKLVEGIALKRLGSPDDIAHAVLFFASGYAGWVTGQVLSVDGGR